MHSNGAGGANAELLPRSEQQDVTWSRLFLRILLRKSMSGDEQPKQFKPREVSELLISASALAQRTENALQECLQADTWHEPFIA